MEEYRDDKGRFVKGYKKDDIPDEVRLKTIISMSESWKKRGDYIGDIMNECPRIYNSWRAIMFTKKGKKAGVSEEWKKFRNFYNDVRPTYHDGLVFRRLDTSKEFSKENFIWCTKEEAVLLVSNLVWMEYEGNSYTLKQLADKFGQPLNAIKIRYHQREKRGYSVEEIIFGRKKKRGSKRPKDILDEGIIIRAKASKMISSYRTKDRKNGLTECDLDIDWMIDNIFTKPCVYCGDTHRIGCDRIDNSRGHTKDNVVPCCVECNTARSDNFSFEEMKILGQAIRQIKIKRGTNLLENSKPIMNNGRVVNNMSKHKTYKFDLNKNLLDIFDSVNAAAQSVNGTPKALSAAAMGKSYKSTHKYKGFLWSHSATIE